MEVNASIAKVDMVKFDETSNFRLWQRRVKDLMVQQGLVKALYGKTKKPEKMIDDKWEELKMKAVSTIDYVWQISLCMMLTVVIWLKLKSQYMSKSFTNKLNLKQNFMGLRW